MFDFLRSLTKSAEEKRQEQIHAYISNSLSDVEKRQFEAQLGQDADLQTEVDSLLQLRQAMRSMPQRRARRSFALDSAKYGKPQSQRLGQLYPMVRTATALTAVFLVIALGAEFFTTQNAPQASAPTTQQESADSVAMGAQASDDSADSDEMMVESASVAEEEIVEEELAEEEEMEEVAMFEEDVAEEAPPIVEGMMELAAPENGDSDTSNTAADSAEIAATTLPQPTADTPRVSPTPTLDDRTFEADEVAEADGESEFTAVDEQSDDVALTRSSEAIPEETAVQLPSEFSSPISPLRLAQIGLAITLVGLLMLLRAARMQR